MDKTPTLTSKISPLHCAPHAPTPNYPMICGTDKNGLPHRIMPIICNSFSHRVSFRVTTKIMFKKQGTATASAGKSTAKKVAAPSSILRPLVVCGSHTLSAFYCFIFHPFFTIWIPTLLWRRKNLSRKYSSAFACGWLSVYKNCFILFARLDRNWLQPRISKIQENEHSPP